MSLVFRDAQEVGIRFGSLLCWFGAGHIACASSVPLCSCTMRLSRWTLLLEFVSATLHSVSWDAMGGLGTAFSRMSEYFWFWIGWCEHYVLQHFGVFVVLDWMPWFWIGFVWMSFVFRATEGMVIPCRLHCC